MSKKYGYLKVLLNYLPPDFEGIKKTKGTFGIRIFFRGGLTEWVGSTAFIKF